MRTFFIRAVAALQAASKRVFPKKFHRYEWIVFFVFVLLLGGVVLATPAFAGIGTDMLNALLEWISWLFLTIARVCLSLTIFFLRFFITLASYNNYINADVVELGWVMVRDVANMFFVVAILAIAFATILGVEQYEWKRGLVKLILAAILINFSNLIAQVFIDAAHVFTITFLNAVSATASGNLINMFSLNEMMKFVGVKPNAANQSNLRIELLAGSFVAMLFAFMAMIAMGAYTLIMAIRVVLMWVLIILSPLAYIFQVIPKMEDKAQRWWKEFGEQVVVAPYMVFFLWLSFAALGSGKVIQEIQDSGDVIQLQIDSDQDTTVSLSKVSSWENMASFLVALMFMFIGIKEVGETGAVGSRMIAGATRFGKNVFTIASGYAAGRWLAGKGGDGIKGGLYHAPMIGGKRWGQRWDREKNAAKLWYYRKAAEPQKGFVSKAIGAVARSGISTEKALAKTEKHAEVIRNLTWKRTGSESGGTFFSKRSSMRDAQDRLHEGELEAESMRSKAKDEEYHNRGRMEVLSQPRYKYNHKLWKFGTGMEFEDASGTMAERIEQHKMKAEYHQNGIAILESNARKRMMKDGWSSDMKYGAAHGHGQLEGKDLEKSTGPVRQEFTYNSYLEVQAKAQTHQTDLKAMQDTLLEKKLGKYDDQAAEMNNDVTNYAAGATLSGGQRKKIDDLREAKNSNYQKGGKHHEAAVKARRALEELEPGEDLAAKSIADRKAFLEEEEAKLKKDRDLVAADIPNIEHEIQVEKDKGSEGDENILNNLREKKKSAKKLLAELDDDLTANTRNQVKMLEKEKDLKDETKRADLEAEADRVRTLKQASLDGRSGISDELAAEYAGDKRDREDKLELLDKDVDKMDEKERASFDELLGITPEERDEMLQAGGGELKKHVLGKKKELAEELFDLDAALGAGHNDMAKAYKNDAREATKALEKELEIYGGEAEAIRAGGEEGAYAARKIGKRLDDEARRKHDAAEEKKREEAERGGSPYERTEYKTDALAKRWYRHAEAIEEGGISLAWKSAVSQALQKDINRQYQAQHGTVLSDAADYEINGKRRNLNTPKSTYTPLYDEFERDYSEMSYEQFVENGGGMVKKYVDRRARHKEALEKIVQATKDGNKAEEQKWRAIAEENRISDGDKAALIALMKRGMAQSWMDDLIISVMADPEVRAEIGHEIGWTDFNFSLDKIKDVEMFFATGADLTFTRDNAVISEVNDAVFQDEALADLNIDMPSLIRGMKTGDWGGKLGNTAEKQKKNLERIKESVRARFKHFNRELTGVQNDLLDDLLAAEAKKTGQAAEAMEHHLNVTRENQPAFQMLGNLREGAIMSGHGENAGWALLKSIGGGEQLYMASGVRQAQAHVNGDVNKTDTRIRGKAHSHTVMDRLSEEFGQTALRVNEKNLALYRSGIIDMRSRGGTNPRFDKHFNGLHQSDNLNDTAFKNDRGEFKIGASKLAQADWEVDDKLNYQRHLKGKSVKDQAKIREALTARNIVKHVMIPHMRANMQDFLMTSAVASGISQPNALQNGTMRISIPTIDRNGNVGEPKSITNVKQLISSIHNGDFGDDLMGVRIPPFIPDKQSKEQNAYLLDQQGF